MFIHSTVPFRLALCNSGAIRAPFDAGNVTMEDLLTSFPFANTIDAISLKGKHIRKALEHSVAKLNADGTGDSGRFLQVSGFKVVYDTTKDIGSRVVSVKVLNDNEEYEDMKDEAVYNLVAFYFIVDGGSGYNMIKENKKSHSIGELDIDALKLQFAASSPVTAKTEGRITLKTSIDGKNRSSFLSSCMIMVFSIAVLSFFVIHC